VGHDYLALAQELGARDWAQTPWKGKCHSLPIPGQSLSCTFSPFIAHVLVGTTMSSVQELMQRQRYQEVQPAPLGTAKVLRGYIPHTHTLWEPQQHRGLLVQKDMTFPGVWFWHM
jgi:hypothetical protein